ncbi:MAG TPA: signal peptidase I [Pirellulaceae bacterium]|nr:signal peptidase I [Pirellulaceae bacterium]
MNRGRAAAVATRSQSSSPAAQANATAPEIQTTRETIESVVVAVVLAFLFRAFVAEAFVIPTGSMAPTLQGRHLDIYCDQCGHRFQTGASSENYSPSHHDFKLVEDVTCPVCRYTIQLDRSSPNSLFLGRGNTDAFNGDRILVSKFAYQLADPKRWDVIVFKYPGNAKQNYIKRLVGLPGETIRIHHGDVFVRTSEEEEFRIARKPADKVKAMLQLVDDTANIAQLLQTVGWPSRWSQEPAVQDGNQWIRSDNGSQFRVAAGKEESWLRYRHRVPWPSDWDEMHQTGELPERHIDIDGQLIMDYYPYNDSNAHYVRFPGSLVPSQMGSAWVGDLAIESNVVVKSDDGHLLLKLVEGGTVFDCRIDVSTGEATLTIDNGNAPFVSDDGQTAKVATADTKLRGAGTYRLRFANVDDKLFLWINERSIEFDVPTTFARGASQRPKWTSENPFDQAPIGIGGQNIEMQVTRLKVLRDIYYLALETAQAPPRIEYESYISTEDLKAVMTDPRQWATTKLFASRRDVEFELDEDQFFPMGDNSPQSKDARLWSTTGNSLTGYDDPPPYVERRYLIGKALLIYWPHAWRPFWPNFSRMGTIR